MTDIIEAMKARGDLPALPELLVKLNKKIHDPNSSMEEIAEVIKTDPALAGRISRLANSAFYAGGRHEVKDLNMAVARLGLREIKNVVFAMHVHQIFKLSLDIDERQFWTHSIAVGIGAQKLAAILGAGMTDQEIAYMAGLLHDVGILVFGYVIPTDYALFLKEAVSEENRKNQLSLHAQEWDRFGVDHPELGAAFIETWWELNEEIVEAVKQHHVPLNGGFEVPPVSRVINVVNSYCGVLDFTNGINTYRKQFDYRCFRELHLTEEQVAMFTLELKNRVAQQAAAIYGK